MDTIPNSSVPKRPRPKIVVKKSTSKAARKTPATREASTKTRAIEAEIVAAPVDMHRMIETAAFYLAAERGFAPGRELEDWLEAERRIKAPR